MPDASITPSKPYLIRAVHEWLGDNGLTPQLVVNAEHPGVQVPREYVRDGLIVLNISLSAVNGLALGNDVIEFAARFSGKSRTIRVPVGAVLGLHARENSVGMSFPREDEPTVATAEDDKPDDGDGDGEDPTPPRGGATRPSLRVVK